MENNFGRFSEADRYNVAIGLDVDWATSRQGETGNADSYELDVVELDALAQDAVLWDGATRRPIELASLIPQNIYSI